MAKDKVQLQLQFKGIKEKSFSNTFDEEILKDFRENNIELSIGFSVSGSAEEEILAITILTKFRYLLPNKKAKQFITFSTESTFKFSDLLKHKDEVKISDSEVFVNDNLMALLLNVAIGATRGMLAYKTTNLPIALTLPLVDVKELMDAFQKQEIKENNKKQKNK